MNAEDQTAKANFDTLMGGVEINAQLRDGSNEAVKVLQLGIDKYPELVLKLEDECELVELYCAKPAGWAAKLIPRSHHEIIESAERLNQDFFFPWLRRRMAKLEAMRPGAVDKMFAGLTLPSGLPKRPSPAV